MSDTSLVSNVSRSTNESKTVAEHICIDYIKGDRLIRLSADRSQRVIFKSLHLQRPPSRSFFAEGSDKSRVYVYIIGWIGLYTKDLE